MVLCKCGKMEKELREGIVKGRQAICAQRVMEERNVRKKVKKGKKCHPPKFPVHQALKSNVVQWSQIQT